MSNNHTLADIFDTISKTHKFPKEDVIFLNTSDVSEGHILTHKYMPVKELKGQAKKTIQNGDILFSEIRPKNKRYAYVKDIDNTEDYVVSTKLMVLRNKRDDVDTDYVYYFLTYSGTLDYLQMRAENRIGSFPQITFDVLKPIQIRIPSLIEQEKIASILSTLDKKIELNNKINQKLEAMAKTLYNYWFVQFDFPDAEGKPYKISGGKMVYSEALKREIPEEWKDGKLEDFSSIISGSTPSKSKPENFSYNGTPWITPKDLSNNTGNKFISKGAISVSQIGLKSTSLRKLPKGTILLSTRAPIGYMAIARNMMTTNQGFKSFIPKEGYSSQFIFYTLKSIMKLIEKNASGSTFKEISSSVIKELKIVLPPFEFISLYSQKVQPIFDRQDLLEQENKKLTQLRDWLLPMLMNGQVKVGDMTHISEELMVAEPSVGYGES